MPKLDAIGVIATDMAATLAFYRLLGLDLPEDPEAEGHVEADLGGGFRLMFDSVDVIQSFTTYEPPAGGRSVGFAFRCDSPADVDATFERVTAAGHAAKELPFDAPWGQRYASLFDPDGNPVDLYAALD